MFVPKEMKLNAFKEVAIPRNRDLFARFGVSTPKGTSYSGDQPAVLGARKMDTIAFADGLNAAALKDESQS